MKLQVIYEDKKKGFTLVEFLIVIAITLIVASVSIPIYGSLQQTTQLNDISSNIIQTIRIAQNRASFGLNDFDHGVYFDISNQQYILYQGGGYSSRNSDYDQIYEYDDIVSITTDLINNEIVFTNGLSQPDNYGQIQLDHQTGGLRSITINEKGYVQED